MSGPHPSQVPPARLWGAHPRSQGILKEQTPRDRVLNWGSGGTPVPEWPALCEPTCARLLTHWRLSASGSTPGLPARVTWGHCGERGGSVGCGFGSAPLRSWTPKAGSMEASRTSFCSCAAPWSFGPKALKGGASGCPLLVPGIQRVLNKCAGWMAEGASAGP